MLDKFRLIREEYQEFYNSFYSRGKMVMKDTCVGIWGVSDSQDVYNFFCKINLGNFKNFVDLGSGDGKVVLIASLFCKATGIEADDELFDAGVKIKNKLNINADLVKDDFFNHDISKYDVIYINPDKGFHRGTEDFLLKNMKPSAKLVVYNNVFKPRFLKQGKTFWFERIPIVIYTKN